MMDATLRAYFWDRLLRAHVRGDTMTAAQRRDLSNDILSAMPTTRQPSDSEKALAEAAEMLLDGSYDVEQWVRYAKANKTQDLDTAAVRAERGINVHEQEQPLEKRLAALLES